MGFGEGNAQESFQKLEEEILAELRRTFSPEFINRIDEVIVFNPLGENELRSIVDILMEDVNLTLSERGLRVEVSAEAKEWLLKKAGIEPSTGARPLRRTIQRHIQDPVSEILINRHGESIGRIEVDLENGELSFLHFASETPELLAPH
jgi:ATP-dependent Clp protease ATP-binding subunit ClpC